MPFDSDDLATRLLNRAVTPERLRKLKRLIDSDTRRDAVIAIVLERAGADVAQQVREGLA